MFNCFIQTLIPVFSRVIVEYGVECQPTSVSPPVLKYTPIFRQVSDGQILSSINVCNTILFN